jgi:hypothetical protein
MPARTKPPRFCKQPPRYRFFLNPYPEVRCTTCPRCQGRTKLRKVPLVIHVSPLNPLALNKTCRYCPGCDLLIAHRDEVESFLAAYFAEHDPEVIGNDYLVIGTLDRPDWRRGTKSPLPIQEIAEHLYDFREVLQFELVGGWQHD